MKTRLFKYSKLREREKKNTTKKKDSELFMRNCSREAKINAQGPVVQSVVSLTSSLRVISLTVLADSIYNILIFFAEKM